MATDHLQVHNNDNLEMKKRDQFYYNLYLVLDSFGSKVKLQQHRNKNSEVRDLQSMMKLTNSLASLVISFKQAKNGMHSFDKTVCQNANVTEISL